MPFVEVPSVRAQGVEAATKKMEDAGFKVQKKPVAGRNALGLGVVSYTDPDAGSKARKGSTITLYYV
ncbi:PASTA domain-containing protein [Propionibacteriaceae bacterium Y1700]|uniref:PASTA domain-containing protein n=1 Tax=Microlunatus sp. Y1700 TaxID=3418487 RepID=UPI003B7CBB81